MGDLDEQYRTILQTIKPLIMKVDKPDIISQAGLWLERLNSSEQKKERNMYLLELVRQIQAQNLTGPFLQPPPTGALSPITQIVEEFPPLPLTTDDEDDWVDISEYNSTIGDGDKKSKGSLKEEGSELRVRFSKKFEEQENKQPDKPQISAVSHAYGSLETKIKDLVQVRQTLQEAQQLAEDWKNKYQQIQNLLKEAQGENLELRHTINSLNEKVSEMQDSEDKEKKSLDQELSNLKQRLVDNQKILKSMKGRYEYQIQALKTENEDVKMKYEKLMNVEAELKDVQIKLDNQYHICNGYQCKIREASSLNDELMKKNASLQYELDAEKSKFQIENQKNHQQEEHIINLQRSLSKTEKLYHKMEKDCIKRIEQLKVEQEIREQTLEIKWKNEKLETLARHNVVKQAEFDKMIHELEEKYKKFAYSLQTESLEIKRKNEEVIEGLKSILDKSGISPFRAKFH